MNGQNTCEGWRVRWIFAAITILMVGLLIPTQQTLAAKRHRTAATTPTESPSPTTSPDTAAPVPSGEIQDRGAATPKALIEDMAALLPKNPQDPPPAAWTGFQPPENRDMAKQQLELAAKMGAKARTVTQVVQTKIGKTEASTVATLQKGVVAGWQLTLQDQLSRISEDGKVDWSKVKLTETGNKAEATIAPGFSILIEKANDKWYLGNGEKHDTLPDDFPTYKKMTEADIKMLDQLQQGVEGGQITKSNYYQKYSDLVNESMKDVVP
jgi:hypothetical protein